MTKNCEICGYEDHNDSFLDGEDCPRCLEIRQEWLDETGCFSGEVGTLTEDINKTKHLRIIK